MSTPPASNSTPGAGGATGSGSGSRSGTGTSTGSDVDIDGRRTELQEIRMDLRETHTYLRDDEDNTALWRAMAVWLQLSHDQPVGSVRSLVRQEFMSLNNTPEHRMFDHEGVEDGEDAFPDACSGCPHYGVACPILAQWSGEKRLKRVLNADVDDETVQQQLSELAADKNCHVLSDILGEWGEGYRTFAQLGEVLRTEANAAVSPAADSAADLTPISPDEVLAYLQTEYQTDDGLRETVRAALDADTDTDPETDSDSDSDSPPGGQSPGAVPDPDATFEPAEVQADDLDPDQRETVEQVAADIMRDDDDAERGRGRGRGGGRS